jgi:GxxExxY protein
VKPQYMHSALTEAIIGAAYQVHNTLGHGFLEKVYENALAVELRERGFALRAQCPVEVSYRGELVGRFVADLVVEGQVVVEVKAASALDGAHEAQLINYLKATGNRVGLLINFGPQVEVRRRVFGPAPGAADPTGPGQGHGPTAATDQV